MLPLEMRERKHWVICGNDKRPYFQEGVSGKIVAANVTNPNTWMTFDQAKQLAEQWNVHFGYVLSKDDLYTCIDFDVKDAASLKDGQPIAVELWTPEIILQQQDRIVNAINSYKEVSVSGKGIHLWVKGNIGAGVKRGGVEVYSQDRFIICTGQSFNTINRTIVDHTVKTEIFGLGTQEITNQEEFLQQIVGCLREPIESAELVELPEEESDDIIIQRACSAENSDKFTTLARGEWESLGYPSQSEADLSLMSMIAFYSKSNAQCRRIFRVTELGKRSKALKNDVYLNRTLTEIRTRQKYQDEINLRHHLEAVLLAQQVKQELEKEAQKKIETFPEVKPVEGEIEFIYQKPFNFDQFRALTNPPGVLGEICEFIYNSAPRPVREVSIVGGLGLVAGAAGRAYHLEQTGLNLYLILVAQSAVGKEALHTGISYIVRDVSRQIPEAGNFVNFNEFRSAVAITKQLEITPSFVNVSGELGRRISQMAKTGMENQIQEIRTQITNLYQKSAPGSTAGGLSYSDKDKNVSIRGAVAYSLIGETTPSTLYESLTEDMMADGFISRFSFIQYTGQRVPLQYNRPTKVPESLLNKLVHIFNYCLTGNADKAFNEPNSIRVKLNEAAWLLQFDFNLYCDTKINQYENESFRQMWNRAHLKALRIAGLLAVCENPAAPVVTLEQMRWAINLVLIDVDILNKKVSNGDIGDTDDSRISKIKEVTKQYLAMNASEILKIKGNVVAQKASIIPRSYLQMRTCGLGSFRNHKLGSTAALNQSVQALIDNGCFVPVSATLMTQHRLSGKWYQVIHL